MSTVSLKINGKFIEGMDDAQVKLTLNNISPVTMTGDSVAFSATIKVPRTPENDSTFSGLNKGLLYCEYYDTELYIRSLPFKYMAGVIDQPAKFYSKVSASPTEYTINLVESTDKWADATAGIYSMPANQQVTEKGVTQTFLMSAMSLADAIKKGFNFPQNDIPSMNPVFYPDSPSPSPGREAYMKPTIICQMGSVSWDDNVLGGGATKLIPQTSVKGPGGYVYPSATRIIVDREDIYLYSSYFYDSNGGSEFGLWVEAGRGKYMYLLLEYTGATIPTTKPPVKIQGVGQTTNVSTHFTYRGQVSERVWIYRSYENGGALLYPKKYPVMTVWATVNGVSTPDLFKFPDGYSPDEVIVTGDGNLRQAVRPTYNAAQPVPLAFPYSNAKTIVDDLCTAFHWRKIFKGGTLAIEPIINPAIRDKAYDMQNYLIDWSDKFVSLETTDVPDEFADQYVCTVGDVNFSYSTGKGSITFVKEAYKSGAKLNRNNVFPLLAVTDGFNGATSGTGYYFSRLDMIYYSYIQRHFKMFAPRVRVKIKAILDYETVENIRLDRAYYFSQLSGYFYLKSLGEYNVDTGECKLSLYKLDI